MSEALMTTHETEIVYNELFVDKFALNIKLYDPLTVSTPEFPGSCLVIDSPSAHSNRKLSSTLSEVEKLQMRLRISSLTNEVKALRSIVEKISKELFTGNAEQKIPFEDFVAIDKAVKDYELNNKEEVQLFLQENVSIIALVNETYSKIHDFIPETKKVTLEMLTDPEENQKNLVANVYTDIPVDEALDKLDAFDQHWFAFRFINSDMLFNVSLECE